MEGGEAQGPWVVIQSNPKCEMRAFMGLQDKGMTILYPITRKKVTRARQSIDVVRPLFTGYLFLRLDRLNDAYEARLTDGVRDILRNNGSYLVVPKRLMDILAFVQLSGWLEERTKRIREEERLARIARGEEDDDAPPEWVQPGALVEVSVGPYAGLIAQILQARPKKRADILLNFLGRENTTRGVSLEHLRPAC